MTSRPGSARARLARARSHRARATASTTASSLAPSCSSPAPWRNAAAAAAAIAVFVAALATRLNPSRSISPRASDGLSRDLTIAKTTDARGARPPAAASSVSRRRASRSADVRGRPWSIAPGGTNDVARASREPQPSLEGYEPSGTEPIVAAAGAAMAAVVAAPPPLSSSSSESDHPSSRGDDARGDARGARTVARSVARTVARTVARLDSGNARYPERRRDSPKPPPPAEAAAAAPTVARLTGSRSLGRFRPPPWVADASVPAPVMRVPFVPAV